MLWLFTVGFPDNPTSRTLLASVPCVNCVNADTQSLGLVGQDTPELRKAPVGEFPIHVTAFIAFDLTQVFQNNHVYVTATAQDGVDGTMENIGPEAVLTFAEAFEPLSSRRCAFGFEFSPSFPQLGRAEIKFASGIEAVVTGNGYVPNALVNTK